MKNALPAIICLTVALSACSKKTETQNVAETQNAPAPYDTIPLDSFATGANPEFLQRKEDSVRQIFLDSVNAVKAKEAEAKNKDKEKKQATEDKKKTEDQKKTAEKSSTPEMQADGEASKK